MFRSMFNRVLSIVTWAALGLASVATTLTPGALPALIGIPLGSAGVAALVWVFLWSPHLRVDDESVTVTNVFVEYNVPWTALVHVDTQYALTLHTPGRRVRVTGAPAPGQLAAFRATRAEKRRLGRLTAGSIRPGDLPGTDSGVAAEIVRGRWERLRDEGRIEAGIADASRVAVHARPIPIAAAVIGTISILAGAFSV